TRAKSLEGTSMPAASTASLQPSDRMRRRRRHHRRHDLAGISRGEPIRGLRHRQQFDLGGLLLGQIGNDWTFVGLGGFFGSDTTDMILRNSNTGGFQVYDISNNNITNSAFLGAVGMDWQVTGFGNFSSVPGQTDMMMRNTTTGG